MMVARVSILRAVSCCWLVWATPTVADSILAGTVKDAITGLPVAGVEIQIEYSGQAVGAATTDADGIYRVPFTVPATARPLASMSAAARSRNHEPARANFQLRDGTPVSPTQDIALFPLGTTACLAAPEGHAVIVGHFLAPDGVNLSDLSLRVARSLHFALSTRLQTVRLALELRPSFEPCDAAKPRVLRLGSSFAKALRADAFIGGDIAKGDGATSFTVSTYVSDAHGLFEMPVTAVNRSIDLNSPSGAAMSGETHAAVLTAIAAGLAKRKNCPTAVTVLSVAEQFVDTVPVYMTELRRLCEAGLPNQGLRP